ncbi:MAG: hypothetical protein IPP76_04885 [Moraxellaceae bacterium]|mgnify:CR=1 FL=1|jgi:hypothetical protein|nr:hypothetical protein [Moraxellaceae bacterium]MBL0230149.1 hypothetical protein [Moraxellaceae bacterium]
MFTFTQPQSSRVIKQAHRQWSLAIQQETRQVLMAKRPASLPKDLAKTEIYFKNLRGEVAIMTVHDYMSNLLCLSVMPYGRLRQYNTVDLLLADGWVLR